MMYRYFNNGYFGRGNCPGLGFFNNGWSILLGFGLLIIITLLFYVIVHNKNKKKHSDTVEENLKMRYVQGDITEEEYLRIKNVINK